MEIPIQVNYTDVIDILIVAFIFYKLMVLLQGTRALQMLIGLLILFFATILSKWSGLYTVDWLVTRFWAQILLVMIILFQPELRKTLAKIGSTPFSTRMSELEELKTIEEIIKASVSMASRRIGAIIVLERANELKEIAEMGVAVDAKVSKEIISSIFLPYSPIHDGAIVINGSRVVAAGCFLPLTLNPNVSKFLGTRHRAALGITEENDAVSVVISEETGVISVMMGGKMTRELDAASLRRVLTRIFIKKTKNTKKPMFSRVRSWFSMSSPEMR